MKKILSVLSLLLLLGTESLSPLAFVYAEPDEETVVEEQLDQEESQEQESEVPESFEEISENNEDDQGLSDEVNEEIPVEPQEGTDQQDDIVVQESPEEIQTVDSSDEEGVESIAEEKIELLGEETESSEQEDGDVITTEMIPLEEEKLEEFTIDNTIVEDYEEVDYSDMEYVPGEVVVKYIDEIPEEETPTFVSNMKSFFRNIAGITTDEVSLVENSLEVKEQIDSENTTAVLEIKDNKSVEETIELLQDDPRVEFVEPNYIRHLYTSISEFNTDDEFKNAQYGLSLISRPEAMKIYSGYLRGSNNEVIVGVVDNGVNYYHPDLDDNMWNPSSCLMDGDTTGCNHGYDFFHDKPTPLPNIGDHGTHVAGIIGAEINNGEGIIGVNPYVKIAALKAGNNNSLTSSATTKAIYFAIENGIKVLNGSYGGNKESILEKQALQAFGEAGGLFIAAAGNDHADMELEENKQYPCAYNLDNVICVGSVGINGSFSKRFSNYGVTDVDIAAPGEEIYSTVTGNNVVERNSIKYDFEPGSISACSSEGMELPGWSGGECNAWSDNKGYAYGFQEGPLITSTTMNILGRENTYLSLDIACVITGTSIAVDYLSNETIVGTYLTDTGINRTSIRYTFPILSNHLSSNFGIKLRFDNNQQGNYCLVDNITVFTDPYYSDYESVYNFKEGTSMAAPFVSGLASLVWKLNPNLTNLQVKDIILGTGDEYESLNGRVKTKSVINVLKTLNSVPLTYLDNPTGLISSWDGKIAWTPSASEGNNVNYHYEVIDSGNNVVYSGTIVDTGVVLLNYSEDNYIWTLQALSGYKSSDIITGYICKKPVLNPGALTGYECTTLVGEADYVDDNCSSQYTTIFELEDGTPTNNQITLNTTGVEKKYVYLKNAFGETTDRAVINFTRRDSPLTLASTTINGFGGTTITSTATKSVGNVITLFGAIDGACGSTNVTVKSAHCTYGTANLASNNLSISPLSSSQNTDTCTIVFQDDEGTTTNGIFTYKYNTKTTTSNNSSSNNSSSNNSSSNNSSNSNNSSSNNSSNSNKTTNTNKSSNTNNTSNSNNSEKSNQTKTTTDKLEPVTELELFAAGEEKTLDFSWYDNSDPKKLLINGYTVEMNNAFKFANKFGITTRNSINKANMEGGLTRIAMAKMLSKYAIEVLGKTPDTKKSIQFEDVNKDMDNNYDNGVTLAYQLGIMGKGITKFRPDDTVTRAEFATALSRLLYGTKDSNNLYYTSHINKLYEEGIISNKDPNLEELRGYVMLMLMRSAKK